MDYNKAEIYSIPNTEEGRQYADELFQRYEDKGYHVSRMDANEYITLTAEKVMRR